jgi:ABC-type dipeptide/oligopeptide/nickel transport system permease component
MKSLVGMILSLVGSIFSLFFAIILGILSIFVFIGKGTLADYNLSQGLIDFASSLGFWLVFLAVWLFVVGILGLIFSSMMNNPEKTRKGGIFCLILGALSVNLFMILGGIFGLVKGGGDPSDNLNKTILNKTVTKTLPNSKPS